MKRRLTITFSGILLAAALFLSLGAREVTVDTVASLATARVADGDIVTMLGRNTIGDGLAGSPLLYDVNSAATVDNGITFDGPGSVGRFIRQYDGPIYATWWDTSTANDTVALQAAVNAAAGGTLIIPSGSYTSDGLEITAADTTILGEPGATIAYSGIDPYQFQVSASRVTISSLTIDTSLSDPASAINVASGSDVAVRNCTITSGIDGYTSGVILLATTGVRVSVEGNTVTVGAAHGNASCDGVRISGVGGSNYTIRDNTFAGLLRHGVLFSAVVSDTYINDNRYDGASSAGAGIVTFDAAASRVFITGNLAKSLTGAFVAGAGAATDVSLIGNRTDGTGSAVKVVAGAMSGSIVGNGWQPFDTATAGDTTPTVNGTSVLKTANTAPTTITNFDDAEDGQELTLLIADANTTIAHGATIDLLIGGNHAAGSGDVFRFVLDGTVWREIKDTDPGSGAGTFDTAADTDATPTVSGTAVLKTANTVATTITNFDNGIDGQELTLLVADVNTTVAHNATIDLIAGANHVAASGDVLRFVLDGTIWREQIATVASTFATAAASDATPTVSGTTVLKTANAIATTITNFDDGTDGQELALLVADANTTIAHGATIDLLSGANHVAASGDVLRFLLDSTVWREVLDTNPGGGGTSETIVVDTVAALATASPNDGDIVHLRGRNAVGDGLGGPPLLYDVDSVLAVDNGLVFDGPGSVGRYVRQFEGPIHVTWFGAIPDDAVDDTAAIEAAIAAVPDMVLIQGDQAVGRPSKARGIYFPDGTYNVESTIDIPDEKNVTLFGDSAAGAVLTSTGGTPPDYIFTFENSASFQHAIEIKNLVLQNGGISLGDGQRRYGRIENVQIIGAPVWAIAFGSGNVEWLVEKVAISEGVGGIDIPTTGGNGTDLITVRHTAFIRNTGIDLRIACPSALIDNCDFEVKPQGSEASPFVDVLPGTRWIEFRTCRFGGEGNPPTTSAPTNMLRFGGPTVNASAVDGVTFLDCGFLGLTSGGSVNGFLLNSPPRRCRLINCTVWQYSGALFNEAFSTSLANTILAFENSLDIVLDDGYDTDLFSSSGAGWKVAKHIAHRADSQPFEYPMQNLIVRSNQIDTGGNWLRTNTTFAAVAGPDGIAGSGYAITSTAGGSTSIAATGVSADTPVTFSVWARSTGTVDKIRMAISSSTIWETGRDNTFLLTSDWKQYHVTSTVTGTRTLSCRVFIGAEATPPAIGEGIELAFPQVNEGLAVTPYLANTNTAATLHAAPEWQSLQLGHKSITHGSAAPTSGYYVAGDIRINSEPTVGEPFGWVCSVAGTPGTWTTLEAMPVGSVLVTSAAGVETWHAPAAQTSIAYGDAFEAAAASLVDGDTITLDGRAIYIIADTTITEAYITFLGAGARIQPAGAYTTILNFTGADCVVRNVIVEDVVQTNSHVGSARGINVLGNRCLIDSVTCIGMVNGAEVATGNGLFVDGDDCRITNFRSDDCQYGALRLHSAHRCTVEGALILNCKDHALSVTGPSNNPWIHISDMVIVCDKAGTVPNSNINPNGGSLDTLTFDSCHFVVGTQVNTTGGDTHIKLDLTDHVVFSNCTFTNGVNAGTGYITAIRWEATTGRTETMLIDGCRFSDGFQGLTTVKNGRIHIRDSQFGLDQNEVGQILWGLDAEELIIERSYFKLTTAATVLDFNNTRAATDRLVLRDNIFYANEAGNKVVCDADTVLSPGQIVFTGNRLVNDGAGTFLSAASADHRAIIESDNDGRAYYKHGAMGATETFDWGLEGAVQKGTLDANVTLTFTAPTRSQQVTLILTQDVVGSRTVTWPVNVEWVVAEQQPTPAASSTSIFQFFYDADSDTYYNLLGLAYSPIQLTPTVWLRADRAVYADAGSTPPAAGGTIQTWEDLSGNGNDCSQATSSLRPTWQTNTLAGRPVVRFDGTDDYLRSATLSSAEAQPNTILLIARCIRDPISTDNLFVDSEATGNRHVFYRSSVNAWIAVAGAGLIGGTANTSWHHFRVEYNGANSKIFVDGVQSGATGNTGTNTYTGYTVGASFAGTVPLQGDIFEMVVVPRLLTASEITDYEAYVDDLVSL